MENFMNLGWLDAKYKCRRNIIHVIELLPEYAHDVELTVFDERDVDKFGGFLFDETCKTCGWGKHKKIMQSRTAPFTTSKITICKLVMIDSKPHTCRFRGENTICKNVNWTHGKGDNRIQNHICLYDEPKRCTITGR